MANIIKAATAEKPVQAKTAGVNAIMNSILDGEGMRKRFDDILGKRTPQFLSSIVSLVNADKNLQKAMIDSPMTVIQSALKAATFDLPIDPALGFGYIVPFNSYDKETKTSKKTAQYIIGYKGMIQLCLRTGAYKDIPTAVDVREGELVSYDRLKGKAEFAWIEDETEREKLPIIGYAGYFSLKNGAEKTVYMSIKQIENHEKKNRKGEYMSQGWRDDFDSMARKTVIRNMITHYGLMSIAYQDGNEASVNLANAVMDDERIEASAADAEIVTVENNEVESK